MTKGNWGYTTLPFEDGHYSSQRPNKESQLQLTAVYCCFVGVIRCDFVALVFAKSCFLGWLREDVSLGGVPGSIPVECVVHNLVLQVCLEAGICTNQSALTLLEFL